RVPPVSDHDGPGTFPTGRWPEGRDPKRDNGRIIQKEVVVLGELTAHPAGHRYPVAVGDLKHLPLVVDHLLCAARPPGGIPIKVRSSATVMDAECPDDPRDLQGQVVVGNDDVVGVEIGRNRSDRAQVWKDLPDLVVETT